MSNTITFFRRTIFISLLLLAVNPSCFAANYYWVGGGGDWNDYANHWAITSGGTTFHSQMPTPTDDVFFDVNSFPTAAPTLNVPYIDPVCHNMTWSGVTNVPAITGSSPSGFMKIYGSMTLVPGIIWNYFGDLAFVSSSSGETIFNAGVLIDNIDFNGTGKWTLQDSLSATTIEVLNGTLYSNNKTIHSEQFSMIGTNSFVFLGTSWVRLDGNMGWTGAPPAQLDADSATINFVQNSFGAFPFNGADGIYHHVNFLNNASGVVNGNNSFDKFYSTGDIVINGNNSFDSLLLFDKGFQISLGAGKTQTVIDTLILDGDCQQQQFLYSTISGQAATISKASGNVTISFANMYDIHTTGGANFSANNMGGVSNVTGWNVSLIGPRALYWVNGTGNWNDETHWSLTSGGAGGACIPSSLDDVYFDANSSLGTGDSVYANSFYVGCRNMDWTGTQGNPIFGFYNNALPLYGSLTLVSNMTIHGGLLIEFHSSLSGNTITTAGNQLDDLIFYDGGSWTLMDSLFCSGILVSNGTLNTGNNVIDCGTGTFSVNAGCTAMLGTSKITAESWGVHATANLSAAASDIYIAGYASSFGGGNHIYNNIYLSSYSIGFTNAGFVHKAVFSSPIAGIGYQEVFDTLILNSPDGNFYLQTDSIITVNDALLGGGTPGHLMHIQSSSSGQHSSIFMSTGDTACIDYVTMRDVHGIGGGVFYAGANSVNTSNNNGWNFLACGTPLAINENASNTEIEFFPNPTSRKFSFNSGNNKCVDVKVTDALGKTIDAKFVATDKTIELDLTDYPNGIYFVQVWLEDGSRVTKKVIRN